MRTNIVSDRYYLYLRKSNSSINYVTRPTIQDKASHKRSAYSVGKTFDSVSISVCRGDLWGLVVPLRAVSQHALLSAELKEPGTSVDKCSGHGCRAELIQYGRSEGAPGSLLAHSLYVFFPVTKRVRGDNIQAFSLTQEVFLQPQTSH